MLSEEQPVILRSRIDEEQTWNGTISKIDTQNQIENQNDYMYDSGFFLHLCLFAFDIIL